MICSLNMLFNHPVSEATPNSKITGAYSAQFHFLGIHKWEPDIYIGFSPALHLQCT